MKRALLTLAVVALCAISPASAQQARWTAPSGLWSIDYVSQGWTFADPLPEDLQHYARILIPRDAPPDEEMRMCAIDEVALDRYESDGDRVRATAARMTSDAAAAMYAPRGQSVSAVANSTMDGVGIADISTRASDGAMNHLHRVFFVPSNGRVLFIDIDCIWPPALDPAKAAEIPAILATLAFTTETPK